MRRRTPAWEDEFIAFFHARHAGYVRTAYAIVGSWATAEDAAQEALSRMYASWPGIRGDSPDPYGRRVLVNTCFRMLKSRKGETVTDLVPERPAGNDPHERVDLMDALARLRPRDRAVIALRYLDDLPVAEVAQILGVAEGTVKSQCSRVLQQMRTQLPTRGRT